MRGREHPYGRTPGVARVLLLRDSLAWGWGVNDEETFAATLELLRRIHRRCKELNAPLLVFSIPHLALPAQASAVSSRGEPSRTRLSRRLEEAAERIGFEALSVGHPLFEATRSGHDLGVGDGRPTACGHGIVAAELEPWIRRRLTEAGK